MPPKQLVLEASGLVILEVLRLGGCDWIGVIAIVGGSGGIG